MSNIPTAGKYQYLEWKDNGFSDFKLVRFETVADGSCFFHALLNAFYIIYRKEKKNDGSYVSKHNIVTFFRKDLSDRISSYYDKLGEGEIKKLGLENKEFSLENLIKKLNSKDHVGKEFQQFVSDQINKDIYILSTINNDLYLSGDKKDLLYKQRDSIVLLNINNRHYELVGYEVNSHHTTLFTHDHPFITFLNLKIKS